MAVDPLAKLYPGVSPYQYTGNNPVRYIDIDGRFRMDATDAKRFEYLAYYLSTAERIADIPSIADPLMEWGQFTKEELTDALTWGRGPNLRFRFLNTFGEYRRKIDPENLWIDESIAYLLQGATVDNVEERLLLVVVAILHELVHYGDWQDGESDESTEEGSEFEIDAFGSVLRSWEDVDKYLQRKKESRKVGKPNIGEFRRKHFYDD